MISNTTYLGQDFALLHLFYEGGLAKRLNKMKQKYNSVNKYTET